MQYILCLSLTKFNRDLSKNLKTQRAWTEKWNTKKAKKVTSHSFIFSPSALFHPYIRYTHTCSKRSITSANFIGFLLVGYVFGHFSIRSSDEFYLKVCFFFRLFKIFALTTLTVTKVSFLLWEFARSIKWVMSYKWMTIWWPFKAGQQKSVVSQICTKVF